jgi:glycosyltransferase involved in cell wall biosynthesis
MVLLKQSNILKIRLVNTNLVISIVTCSLYRESLSRTLDSVLIQEYLDWELILVTPANIDIPSKYENHPKLAGRIKYVQDSKQGIYEAMNLGARVASGDYLVFLNGGDEFYNSQSLKELRKCVKENQWGYGIIAISSQQPLARVYKFNPYFRFLHRFGWKYVPHPGSIVSKRVFEEIGGFDSKYRVAADQKLFLEAAKKYEPGISKKIISIFHLGGQSSRSVRESMKDSRDISTDIDGKIFNNKSVDNLIWTLNSSTKLCAKKLLRR